MEARQENKGIFINGKKQIIDMLQYMEPAEREKLLRNIQLKNPQMAKELQSSSLNFEDFNKLDDENLRKVLTRVNAPIIGLALKQSSQHFQRRALSLLPREKAEKAFEIMEKYLNNETVQTNRAQTKMLEVLVNLCKQKIIRL